jgi:FtsH-binding integral membrane protein
VLRRVFRASASREGRNEQRKLRAGVANALAVTLIVAGVVGPYVNPMLAASLTPAVRLVMLAAGVLVHLFAARLVRDMEDRT